MSRKALWSSVLLGATLWTGTGMAEDVGFQSPLALPAMPSAIAMRVPINALAAAGARLITAGQRGIVLYSDDGKQWTQARVPVSSDLTALSFPSPQQGWAVGHEGVILHSTDGGASWQKQLDGKQAADLIAQRYGHPSHPDDPVAQRLQKDAENFVAQGADKPFLDVLFTDETHGFAVGAFNLVFHTDDGGKHWVPWLDRVDNPKGMHLYSVRSAGGSVFIAGEQGLVFKLDPAQQRFVSVPVPYQGTFFGMTGSKDMVLVFGLGGHVLRSTDGGAQWTPVDTKVKAGVSSGVVLADGCVVLASQAGQVLLSRDGGATFERVKTRVSAPVFTVAETASHDVALAGYGGVRFESLK